MYLYTSYMAYTLQKLMIPLFEHYNDNLITTLQGCSKVSTT